MDLKRLSRVEVKDAAKGQVRAVFSTMGTKDKDGDVTVPGAFRDGADVVISAYMHGSWEGKLPVGVGRIKTAGSEAILEGQFFMDTQHGADTFRTVKALADKGLGEWSYGYDVLDSDRGKYKGEDVRFLKSLLVHEVSPVLVGAGVGTRTLETKSMGDNESAGGEVEFSGSVIKPHETKAVRVLWRPGDVDLSDGDIALLRKAFVWVDTAMDPELVTAYKGLHHHTNGDANVYACMYLIGDMIRGASDVPTKDHAAVHAHLAEHLAALDIEAPDLDISQGLKFTQEGVAVLAAIHAYNLRAADVVAMRSVKGKGIASAAALLMDMTHEELRLTRAVIDTPNQDAAREFVRFVRDNMGDKP